MPLSDYQAIRFANERIYGDDDYYDISEYRHVCGWCIGKDYMYLNYILSSQWTELAALPPLPINWKFAGVLNTIDVTHAHMGARVLLLPCNCKGILSCKRFSGYRQENTRRSTAEHKTDYGNTSVIRCGDQGAQKVFADDSRSASRSQWMTLASLGDCCFRSPQKLKICGDPIYRITRSEHRNFSPHASEVSGLWRVGNLDKKKHKWPYKSTRARGCACGLSSKVRTPPLWENTAYLLTNSPEILSSHFCAYFIAIAYSRKRTPWFYIINNHSVFSCASTWFTEWLSIMWL